MKKSDFETLDAIGMYRPSLYDTELYIYSFEKRGDVVRVLYAEYTGFGYEPHIKKVYGMDNEPYFIHNGSRIHFYDCDQLRESYHNGVVLTHRIGESVCVWDYIK